MVQRNIMAAQGDRRQAQIVVGQMKIAANAVFMPVDVGLTATNLGYA
jgi:hypothetical protein